MRPGTSQTDAVLAGRRAAGRAELPVRPRDPRRRHRVRRRSAAAGRSRSGCRSSSPRSSWSAGSTSARTTRSTPPRVSGAGLAARRPRSRPSSTDRPDVQRPMSEAHSERTYVVTGSASGIGAATAKRLRDDGSSGRSASTCTTPTSRPTLVDRAKDADRWSTACAPRRGGRVDGVIACAGISSGDPVTVSINYFGAVATLEGLRPFLAAERRNRAPRPSVRSRCCNRSTTTSSTPACATTSPPPWPPPKARACSCTRRRSGRWPAGSAAPRRPSAWAGAGIPLNAVAPGVVVTTPMTAPLLGDPTWREIVDEAVPMPLGGYARPEEIAARARLARRARTTRRSPAR